MTGSAPALRRILGRRAPPGHGAELLHCELCGAPVADMHRHLLDERSGAPLCVCHPCTVLFDRPAAGGDHYRLIPDRRVRMAPFPTKGLGVPVGLAYLVAQPDGVVVANYPNPLGSTHYEVEPQQWRDVVGQRPELDGLAPTVEAVLINTVHGAEQHWIVPIDDCYRLVAIIRTHWRGLSGGNEVWPAIDAFFDELPRGNRHFGI
ncbi:DUF5947 family protein [Mycolicibacterium poriferae]|uniref:Uncharacterized protein n=1 Tax=Mycolicibacterium poriferae TaxID=39694 RepID=A0A6N4V7V4_9MYCO|nr:DUF5947 family protein [Mycolicibacterium poriferae]MCV7265806.1 hypothetical protein [Mycolicibacterium poriferae]BBX51792.1 hypothetical protein MPOR_28180 [Mycolicibacterium poriferae]